MLGLQFEDARQLWQEKMTEPSTHTATFSESTKLDLIRSLAVLLVVLSHLPITKQISDFIFGENIINIQPMGLVGVGIFFVHTCYVLMLSLNRQTSQLGTASTAIVFFTRRIFRIYPLSIATVLALALILHLPEGAKIDYLQIISNLLLVQNLTGHPSVPGALWSLPYEVQMYLFLPGLFILVSRFPRIAPVLIASVWLMCIAAVLVLYVAGLNYHLVKYFPAFIPGVLAYSLTTRSETNAKLPAFIPSLYIVLAAATFPFLVAYGIRENILLWPTCLLLGLLIPYSKEIESGRAKIVAATVAKYSYGIYLVHGPLVELSFGYLRDFPAILQWTAFIFGTASISYLAFHLIESPGIQLGKPLISSAQNSETLATGSFKVD